MSTHNAVTPAEAGVQVRVTVYGHGIPAFAGMTERACSDVLRERQR